MQRAKRLNLFLYNNPQISMPLIVLLWGIYYIFFGAVITLNEGLGYQDGFYYGNMTKNFYEQVFDQQLNYYRIQRIFPPFIVNSGLSIFNLSKENLVIVKSFQLYNLLLLLLCTFIWYKVSKIYKLNLMLIWLGFVLWFITFGIAKLSFFYPVLTDDTAFFLGFCLLYSHLKDNLVLKIIITFVGAFTWASFVYFGILLILFPIKFRINFDELNSKTLKLRQRLFTFLIPLPFLIEAVRYIRIYFASGMHSHVNTEFIPPFLYISAIFNFLFMSYFLYIFLPNKISLSKYPQLFAKILLSIKKKNILFSILLFIVIIFIQKYLSNNQPNENTFAKMFHSISMYSCTKPFSYFVTAITYFGPCFIIFFFCLKNYKHHLKTLGIGVYLLFIINFIIIFTTEVRMIINFFPFIILLSVLIFKDLSIQKNLFILLIIFSLILSKLYIPMFNVPDTSVDNYQFPNQLLWMNTYPISNFSYFIQFPIIAIMTASILFLMRRNENKPILKTS